MAPASPTSRHPNPKSADTGAGPRSRSFAFEAWVLPISLVLLIAFLLAIGHPAHIREWATWRNLASGSAIAIVVALGLVVPLRAGEFNLAIGVCAGASAIMTATMYVTYDEMLWVCILTGVVTGLVIGAAAGVLVGYFRVNSLIATLGMGILIQGIVEWRTPSGGISALNATQLTDLFNNKIGPIDLPPAVLIALVLALVTYYLLDQVPFGRNLTAIGSNRTAATLVGVRVPRTIFLAFAISGLLGGIAGVLDPGVVRQRVVPARHRRRRRLLAARPRCGLPRSHRVPTGPVQRARRGDRHRRREAGAHPVLAGQRHRVMARERGERRGAARCPRRRQLPGPPPGQRPAVATITRSGWSAPGRAGCPHRGRPSARRSSRR